MGGEVCGFVCEWVLNAFRKNFIAKGGGISYNPASLCVTTRTNPEKKRSASDRR